MDGNGAVTGELVKVSRPAEGVALMTLDRPQAMNALSMALRRELAQTVRELSADDRVRALVLTGAGERAFTAGLDLKELGQNPEALSGAKGERDDLDPVASLAASRVPCVGAINGVAITGGFELALMCDVLIASPNARFADTHSRVGVMPGWGLSQKLSRVVGPARAKELSLTGRFIDAETAARWGIVSRVVPAETLVAEAVALASDIAAADRDFIAALRGLIDEGYAGTFADGMERERVRSGEWNGALTPEALEARRAAVMERGRSQ